VALNLTNEEKFIIKILFGGEPPEGKFLKKINYDQFVKITSSHLIIPLIYSNLKQKKILNNIPKKLSGFLKYIYDENYKRNEILEIEITKISKIFKKEKINHLFLKGSAILSRGLYKNKGSRMIGDIDLLVDLAEKEKIIKLLNENNFHSKYNYKFWKANVEPNFTNPNYLFAIDLHTKLFPNYYSELMKLNRSETTSKNLEVMSLEDEIKYSILNYQISDFGYLKCSYSYRKIYDVYLLSDGFRNLQSEMFEMKFYREFIWTMYLLGICDINPKNNLNFLFFKTRFYYKFNFRLYRQFDNLICKIIIFGGRFYFKFFEFLLNKDYRKFSLQKIKKKLNSIFFQEI
tara:strand:- start:1105 stop:2142 length:1038 start_codon:yes stop_codon:yes gene_type:complete